MTAPTTSQAAADTVAVPLTQESLRTATAARIAAARPELAAAHPLGTRAGLNAAQQDIAAEDPEAGALAAVVLRDFDLAAWVRGTCAFAFGVDGAQAGPWRAAFTRTVFLAGNPEHLAERFAFAHVAEDGSAAWTAPGPPAHTSALRRLLKLFRAGAALPARPDALVELPGAPKGPARTRRLYVATAGATISGVLVHVNHVLAEAALDGLLAPGDRLVLRQVPRLVGLTVPLARVRAVPDPGDEGRLMATAALSTTG